MFFQYLHKKVYRNFIPFPMSSVNFLNNDIRINLVQQLRIFFLIPRTYGFVRTDCTPDSHYKDMQRNFIYTIGTFKTPISSILVAYIPTELKIYFIQEDHKFSYYLFCLSLNTSLKIFLFSFTVFFYRTLLT